jgi:hypothetical protein
MTTTNFKRLGASAAVWPSTSSRVSESKRAPGEHVGEVCLRVDPEAAAVFHDGVEDRRLVPGGFAADEEPVLG